MKIISKLNSSLTLVHNHSGSTHEAVLQRALARADEIYIAVAFMKKNALQSILPYLRSALKRGAIANITVGGDFYLTEPDALTALHKVCRPFHPKARAYLVKPGQGQETFHPKAYCAVHGGAVTILLGSANLTSGGLQSNLELSLIHSTDLRSRVFQNFKSWLESKQVKKRRTELDEITISGYQAQHSLYKRVTRQAERRARTEIRRQFTMDTATLKKYARDYKTDPDEQNKWRTKQRNYDEARKVLDSLINKPPATREEFLATYGDLVGAARSKKLWHSGSIFRAKNNVAKRFRKFIDMLRALRPLIGRPPEQVFELAMSYAARIHGLGPNVVTEILNTYSPSLYPVLNNNPITSLREMGVANYPAPSQFRPETYAQYADLLKNLAVHCGFADLSQVDHFMNYVYWTHAKAAIARRRRLNENE